MTTVSGQIAYQKLDHSEDKSKEKVSSMWIHVWLWEDNTNKHLDMEMRNEGTPIRPCFLRMKSGMVCKVHFTFRWTGDICFCFLDEVPTNLIETTSGLLAFPLKKKIMEAFWGSKWVTEWIIIHWIQRSPWVHDDLKKSFSKVKMEKKGKLFFTDEC